MDYNLAKKLKDAGFERKDCPFSIGQSVLNRELTEEEKINTITLTDLSELIEACGEGILGLERNQGGEWTAHKGNDWNDIDGWKLQTSGSTPEEAVALLWLKLYSQEE